MSEPEENKEQSFVIYTDGGCRPSSRGHAGYGYHGYLYTTDEPKQGIGCKGVPTENGYTLDPVNKKAVSIVKYVDCWAPIPGESTNNVAEVLAIADALEYARSHKVRTIKIYSDSRYALDGLAKYSECGLPKNSDEVSNHEQWERAVQAKVEAEKTGSVIHLNWVRGHNGDVGNHVADTMATRAVFKSMRGIYDRMHLESDPKGYWSQKTNHVRLLSKAVWYFNTNSGGAPKTPCGRTLYHLGKENVVGKRESDSSYSVVALKEPDPVLETIRQYQDEISNGTTQSIVLGDLTKIQQPKNYNDILDFGNAHLGRKSGHTIDLITAEDSVLTKEEKPAMLAFRAVDTLVALEQRLLSYISMRDNNSKVLYVTDITEVFFDVVVEEKKGKKKCSLKKSITTDLKSINLTVKYDLGERNGEVDIRLLFNMDIPSRNLLSAIASQCPKLKIITWPESNNSFRFASILEVDDDIGIWSSIHSNLRILK